MKLPISRKRSKRDFYVYVWLDPRKPGEYVYGEYEFDHEPIYVGKGKGRRASRFKKRNPLLMNKIAKSGTPIVQIIAKEVSEVEVFLLETDLIVSIGRRDLNKGPLCNMTNGGEGMSGHNVSEKTKQRLKEVNIGHVVLKETRVKISVGNTGKKRGPMSKKHKHKISKSNIGHPPTKGMTGRHHSEETKQNMSMVQRKRRKEEGCH